MTPLSAEDSAVTQVSRSGLETFVIAFLIFSNVFDMGGGFGIKYLSYGLLLLLLAAGLPSRRVSLAALALFSGLFLVIPVFSFLIGLFNGAEAALAIEQLTPFLPAFVLFLVLRPNQAPMAWASWYLVMKLLLLAVIGLFAAALLFRDSFLVRFVFDVLASGPHGYFGIRSLGSFTIPNVYFKATLLFVPAFVYAIFIREHAWALMFVAGLFVAFSKAGILLCGIFFAVYLARSVLARQTPIVFSLVLGGLLAAAVFIDQQISALYLSSVVDAIAGRSETATVRVGHLESLAELYRDSPWTLLFGQGVGTVFYSSGVERYVSNIELDHFDAIRKFGLPWFLAMCLVFAIVVFSLFRSSNYKERAVGAAMLSLFVAAGTNPVLTSPITMMLFVCSALLASGIPSVWPGNHPEGGVFQRSGLGISRG